MLTEQTRDSDQIFRLWIYFLVDVSVPLVQSSVRMGYAYPKVARNGRTTLLIGDRLNVTAKFFHHL